MGKLQIFVKVFAAGPEKIPGSAAVLVSKKIDEWLNGDSTIMICEQETNTDTDLLKDENGHEYLVYMVTVTVLYQVRQ